MGSKLFFGCDLVLQHVYARFRCIYATSPTLDNPVAQGGYGYLYIQNMKWYAMR